MNEIRKWEASPRWVRAELNGEIIADSRQVMLVWEKGPVPHYYFPLADVRPGALVPTGRGSHGRASWHVKAGDQEVANAAYGFTELAGEAAVLNEYVALRWPKMDGWYEEDEEVFVHPRDPYKRVDIIASSRHIQVSLADVILADSQRAHLLFETGLPIRYYVPREDVNMDLLLASELLTECPYKGSAVYWSVTLNGRSYEDIVWSYPEPIAEATKIKDLLCFFNEKVDITVDGERQERPKTFWS